MKSMGSFPLHMEHRRDPLVAIHLDRQERWTSFLQAQGEGISSRPTSLDASKQM